MDALTLPCPTCAPTAPAEVVDGTVRCTTCGSQRRLTGAPLYLVTGAPATGKSSVVPYLAGRLPSTAVFDTDLFGPDSHPAWTSWATTWLLVAHGLAQSGLRAVLCGYGISRSKVEALPARALLGPIRTLNLDLDDDVLRARLLRREYDDARVHRKVVAARQLRDEADENVDVTDLTEEDVATRVEAWLRRELSTAGG